jgi:D-serine deaminase-like pyridoxal phosphate-dependent protein
MNIDRPTLLLDNEKCLNNIKKMQEKATKHRLIFRPHFKTHRSAEISNWFKSYGVNSCTVSNIEMAEYFAENNFNDITIAFPANVLQISRIENLARKINLNILIDNLETYEIISKKTNTTLNYFLEIDTGANRTGVYYSNFELIKKIVFKEKNSKKLKLKGLITHAGNTYLCNNANEIEKTHRASIERLIEIKNKLNYEKNLILSIGDTPSCSISDNFEGIDEIRPGNFVFYDVMQWLIGSCSIDEIAICVACPVVSINLNNEIAYVWGGSVHLSKEFAVLGNKKIFGLVATFENNKWNIIENAYVSSISQEHGCLYIPKNILKSFSVGKILGILPVHSCLTVGLMRTYRINGSTELIQTLPDNI